MTANTNRRAFLKNSSATALTIAALASAPPAALAARLRSAAAADTVLQWTHLAGPYHAMIDPQTGGNVLLLADKTHSLLIDTKYPALARALFVDAQTLAGDETTKLHLINTHHHADHTGGNPIIVPNAESYAHENALPRIRDQHQRYTQAARSGPAQVARMEGSPRLVKLATQAAEGANAWTQDTAVPANSITEPTRTMLIAARKVETHHFGPGHTDNDLVINFPGDDILHTGDLVFNGLHPYFDPQGGATATGWINALKKTRALCTDTTTVIPGHGPKGGPKIIDTQITYLETLIEKVQAEIEKGTRKDEITAMSWDFMEGLGFEQVRARAIGAVYDELSI